MFIRILFFLALSVGIQTALAQDSEDQAVYAEMPRTITELQLNTFNAYGSTSNNKIPRFSNTTLYIGDDLTYTDSVADGASVTISEGGIFAIDLSWNLPSGGDQFIGISLNATTSELTTNFSSLNSTKKLCITGNSPIASQAPMANCAWIGRLKKNDVIRPHVGNDVSSPNTTSAVHFHVTKLAD